MSNAIPTKAPTRFRRIYGEGPLHLLAMLATFSFAGYVISILVHVRHAYIIAEWVAGAIVAHDLVLFPLYTAADRLLGSTRRTSRPDPRVPWRNHVRAPVLISGLLLLLTFPLVFNLSEGSYHHASGLTTYVYFNRWLLIAGILFASSAAIYALRLVLSFRHTNMTTASTNHDGSHNESN